MTEQEDFVIDVPYKPTADEQKAITELETKGLVADDWESGKTHIKSFKNNHRRYTYKKQNQLCAFCRIHVPAACVPMHREHIVYKNEHPQWMFLPENLCVACPNCNDYKGTTEVLENPRARTYPKTSAGFKIIHPYHDRYSDHIELIGDILYRGKTDKGTFTINTCHLYRVDLAEERANQLMLVKNKGTVIAGLMKLLLQSEEYVDDNGEFEEYVKDMVKDYMQKQENAQ